MKSVVITGAAGGIGQALSLAFHEAGYRVVAADKSDMPAGLACDQYVKCDLRRTVDDAGYAREILSSVSAALAGTRLSGLINNAAVQIVAATSDLGPEEWSNTLAVNLLAPFVWTKALLADLESGNGMVLNVSSIHARLTKPGFVAYATSKAALSGLTRAMAIDLAGRVRINALEPAAIDTEMLRDGLFDAPDKLAGIAALHPSGSIGNPAHLAAFARSIIEAEGTFLNGAVIGFDGGISNCLLDVGNIK